MRKSRREEVVQWRKKHPHGRRRDLYRSESISKATVDRWWNDCGVDERPFSAAEKIAQWRLAHPDSDDRKQCKADTGLSLRSVYLRWDADNNTATDASVSSEENDVLAEPQPAEGKGEEQNVLTDQYGQMSWDF